jgi:hypothetical protein
MSVFRPVYRELSLEEKDFIDFIKSTAEVLHEEIVSYVPEGRERSIAKTKLEEAIMWAVKGITK